MVYLKGLLERAPLFVNMCLDFFPKKIQQTLQRCHGSRRKRTVSAPEMFAHFFQQRNKIPVSLTAFQTQKQISNIWQSFPTGGAPAA